jgi:DNA ligase-1
MATLWSRGNELISHQFPELIEAFKKLPEGTVLDGEILAYRDGSPLPFSELQKRLGRKNVSKSMIEKIPIVFMIYDILEYQGDDIRSLPLSERRAIMEHLPIDSPNLILSKEIKCQEWSTIQALRLESRARATEGIMLKKLDSVYGVGRQKGFWWKYKVDPMTLDAVLIYAQAGSGRRANLFTDYTFALRKGKELVPIAKAYSGLDQQEIKELDAWIRRNTEEKFGPVRKVKPFHVFEIAFEGIQLSKRHKSGIALRFPRISRWRKDKPYEECDSLDTIKETFFHDKV